MPPFAVLYWRSVCDLGIGFRFMTVNAFSILLCGQTSCTRADASEYYDLNKFKNGNLI